jgi:hypothetical protein
MSIEHSDQPRHLDWSRFAAEFANAGRVGKCDATVGVAPDICPCCDERYVVLATIHPDGIEVSVSLNPTSALQVANAILDAYAKISLAPAGEGVRQ